MARVQTPSWALLGARQGEVRDRSLWPKHPSLDRRKRSHAMRRMSSAVGRRSSPSPRAVKRISAASETGPGLVMCRPGLVMCQPAAVCAAADLLRAVGGRRAAGACSSMCSRHASGCAAPPLAALRCPLTQRLGQDQDAPDAWPDESGQAEHDYLCLLLMASDCL